MAQKAGYFTLDAKGKILKNKRGEIIIHRKNITTSGALADCMIAGGGGAIDRNASVRPGWEKKIVFDDVKGKKISQGKIKEKGLAEKQLH